MSTIVELTSLLEKTIYSPTLESDPSYISIKQNLSDIVSLAIARTGYTIDTLPNKQEYYVILIAQTLVYRTLATAKAPDYNVESEFTKITKSDRFTHYMKLIESVQKEIDSIEKKESLGEIDVGNLVINERNGSERNYALSAEQSISLTVSNITSNSADLDWSLFDCLKEAFYSYELYLGKSIVYDPYENPSLIQGNVLVSTMIQDIKRTKFRLKSLTPSTNYFLTICYKSANGGQTFYSTTFSTIA
jgi:hypothetical protein